MFVICYPTVDAADQVLKEARHLQAAHLIHLEDAVTISRTENGRLSIRHGRHRRVGDTALGAIVGALLGKVFGTPFVGSMLGATVGSLAEKLPDTIIDDSFVHELGERLGPNSSASFALIRRARPNRVLSAPEKVIPQIGRFGGTVLHTTLTDEEDERLQTAIDEEYRKALALSAAAADPDLRKKRGVKTPEARRRPLSAG